MSTSPINQVIRSTRDFIHDVNNKLMVAAGHNLMLKEEFEGKKADTALSQEELDTIVVRLKKVEKALGDIESLCKNHREHLIGQETKEDS